MKKEHNRNFSLYIIDDKKRNRRRRTDDDALRRTITCTNKKRLSRPADCRRRSSLLVDQSALAILPRGRTGPPARCRGGCLNVRSNAATAPLIASALGYSNPISFFIFLRRSSTDSSCFFGGGGGGGGFLTAPASLAALAPALPPAPPALPLGPPLLVSVYCPRLSADWDFTGSSSPESPDSRNSTNSCDDRESVESGGRA